MRNTILGIFFCVASLSTTAQKDPALEMVLNDEAGAKPAYVLRVGPTFGIVTGGIASDNAEGRKVNPDFWFLNNYGVAIYAPFDRTGGMGLRMDVGVTSTGTRTRPYEFYDGKTNWKGYMIERYNHFTIAPQISLHGVLIGVGFNIPMSGEMWNPQYSDTKFVVDRTTMTMAVDVRLGGQINVWHSKVGVLTVDIMARYFLGGLYRGGEYTNGYEADNLGNPRPGNKLTNSINLQPASIHLGLGYQFKIGL